MHTSPSELHRSALVDDTEHVGVIAGVLADKGPDMVGLPFLLGVLALAPITAAPEPTAVTAADEVSACGWPSVVEVWVGPAQCTGTLVHPQLVLLTTTCTDYAPGTDVGLSFGDASGGLDAVAPIDACSFDDDGFGFCKLAAALPIPYAPILAGCEHARLTEGATVTLVGYGTSVAGDYDTTKRHGTATVSDVGDAVFFLEGEHAPCTGDSGAPALLQLDDGSWRAAGLAYQSSCDNPSALIDLTRRIPWLEQTSGLDLTPCHDADGLPDPTDACAGFYSGDAGGTGTWNDLCGGAPIGGAGGVCSGDVEPPSVSITAPADGTAYPEPVALVIEVAADDGDGLGIRDVRLEIGGMLLPEEDRTPPYAFSVDLPRGQWPIVAVARDWGGNTTASTTTTLWVGIDPVPMGGSSSEGADASDGDEPEATTTDGGVAPAPSDGSDEGGANQQDDGDVEGCGCTTGDGPTPALLLIALSAAARRRRRMAVLVVAHAVACGGSGAQDGDTAAESTSSHAGSSGAAASSGSESGAPPQTSAGASSSSGGEATGTSTTESGTSGADSTTGEIPDGPAGPGYENCLAERACTLGAQCLQDTWEVAGACSVPCGSVDDCPPAQGGNAPPSCVALEFGGGACMLDCSDGQTCPDDMTCWGHQVCMYLATPAGGGTCPDEVVVGAPATVMGMSAADDVTPSCFISGDDATVQFTAGEAGWYSFDAEEPGGPTLAALTECGGSEIECATGFAQYTAAFLLELAADQTIVLVVDTSDPAAYQLDIAYLGDPEAGDCCFGGGHVGCHDDAIESCVCSLVPSCCDGEWTDACALLATSSCAASCE